jgi:two-component system CheB/CheR fusion protein
VHSKQPPKEKKITGAMEKIFAFLQAQTGNDFSLYKINTVHRRIERRMGIHQIGNISQYVRYLQDNPHEIDLLFKELLIGVTNFFREPEAFEFLTEKIVPQLVKDKKNGGTVRVWVVGCSTGEEAYSIAMVIRECLDDLKLKNKKIQIYATDIDKEAIDVARQGTYPANIAADVSPERLKRFFTEEDGRYRIKKEIRDGIIFAPQNVLTDPPFTKLDLLSCRNLLIYLKDEAQKKLLPLFHYSLNPGGYLFLGSSETIGTFTDLFNPVDSKWKIFERRENPMARMELVEFPVVSLPHEIPMPGAAEAQRKAKADVTEIAKTLILQSFAPPAVLINDKGDILYLTSKTGKYLELPVGKANMNIHAMAREGLRLDLGIVIRKAMNERKKTTIKGIQVKMNGSEQMINLTAVPFDEPEAMRGLMMVVFEDVEMPAKGGRQAKRKSKSVSNLETINNELEKELKYTKEHLQTVVEEMETSQEELKSSNEELQSTNEELQSTNEELVTSKEELQSLNEELTTLNSELSSKNEELTEANNDMKNLLNSTQIPTIFLDNDLKIKRFTPPATKIASLIQSDIGRPVTDIMLNLRYRDLVKDAKEVLQTLVSREAQVQAEDGKWYLMRINPYRTAEDVIDGVVITFSDITDFRTTAERLTEHTEYAESIVRTVREPLIVLNGDLKVVSANPSFYRTFRVKPQETVGKVLYDLGNRQWDIPALRELLEKVLPKNAQVEDFMVEHAFPKIGIKKMLLNAQKIEHEEPQKELILLAIEDVTIHKEQS